MMMEGEILKYYANQLPRMSNCTYIGISTLVTGKYMVDIVVNYMRSPSKLY